MSDDEQSTWLSTELLEDANLRKVPEVPASPQELLADFLEWQFQASTFDFAVVAASSENPILRVMGRVRPNWPQVILTLDDARTSQASLLQVALRGFQLVIATRSSAEEMISFFGRYSYRQVGSSPFASDGEHDLLAAAWSREVLSKSVALASRMGAKLICCFGHDADPIYLLSR